MKVALIGCTKRKRNKPSKAIELYDESNFFCKEVAYAERVLKVDSIWILSAKHHLLSADTIVEPYNVTLVDAKKPVREEWARVTFEQIKSEFNPQSDELFLLCGKKYYEFIKQPLQEAGFRFTIPLENIGGIGKQIHWLKEKLGC